MIHLDLFSGIGLFSYAADHVWSLEHIFCEIEKWPYKFLKQEYPSARIERDVKKFNGTEYAGRTFLLTAGVPCQPASVAGKRKGTEDDRWLWPEALRVLFESQAECAIFENPLGILTLENGLVFENLLLEMESQGYAVQPYIIPACALNAVHGRDRVWIVAHSARINDRGKSGEIQKADEQQTSKRQKKRIAEFSSANKDDSNSKQPHHRCEIISKEIEQSQTDRSTSGISRPDSDVSNATGSGLQEPQTAKIIKPVSNAERRHWQLPWPEVAIESCVRGVDVSFTDGIYKAEKFEKGERIKRMKALGNTIQWEVAMAIMQAIKKS